MKNKRYLEKWITDFCFPANKMAFISGPRQCGKTTFTKHLLNNYPKGIYYNWDEAISKNWSKWLTLLDCTLGIQLVMKENVYKLHEQQNHKILVISASQWLKYLI
jgi:ABC-type cobalamin/Fe3+-siderophores transport system ATPase subunit